MTRPAPHWVVILDGGLVVDSGYCYCPNADADVWDHPMTGVPL